MGVLVGQQTPDQTPSQWQQATREKFSHPDIILNNYGGLRLDITAQVGVTLTRGKSEVDAVVRVQKGAPNNLLLGTDLQRQLRFSLLVGDGVGRATDLLSGQQCALMSPSEPEPEQGLDELHSSSVEPLATGATEFSISTGAGRPAPGIAVNSDDPKVGEVRLLQPVSIAAGYRKMVRAEVNCPPCHTLLFTPQIGGGGSLCMADSVIEVGEGKGVTLVIENQGAEANRLKKETRLGETVSAEVLTRTSDWVRESSKESAKEVEMEVKSEESTAPDEEGLVHSLTAEEPPGESRGTLLLAQLNLQVGHLTPEQQQQLTEVQIFSGDVFALNPGELGTTQMVTHTINTGEHAPIRQPVQRTPFVLRAKVEEMVTEMLDQGVIEPSTSPWASPIVLVKKKDGGIRFCVDYRKLNRVTNLDEFPLPRIDDTLDMLAGAQYFTVLDLASGYWQVQMDPVSREKTAFTTHSGLYEFEKMPFGLVNAPATFQRLMEIVLSGLARDKCLVYLDDVLVIGKSLEEHNQNLEKVPERIREAGLRLRPKKC